MKFVAMRDLKINAKVLKVVEDIKHDDGGVPGVITLGVLLGKLYLVDGQHRIGAWKLSGLESGYADVRTVFFDSLGDMAQEFVDINSSLVRLRPDDILRGLESSNVGLQRIRRRCPFIGYDMVRRSATAPMLSMSAFLRWWVGSRTEVPAISFGAVAALDHMDDQDTAEAIDFATGCYDAWHRDHEYVRLWGGLNLLICAWLYRRVVLGQNLSGKATKLTKEQFRNGLLALSADTAYLDYLVGRSLTDRDRSPTYARAKAIIQRRYLTETGKKALLPKPAWATT